MTLHTGVRYNEQAWVLMLPSTRPLAVLKTRGSFNIVLQIASHVKLRGY
jgi:hypothetical protein